MKVIKFEYNIFNVNLIFNEAILMVLWNLYVTFTEVQKIAYTSVKNSHLTAGSKPPFLGGKFVQIHTFSSQFFMNI